MREGLMKGIEDESLQNRVSAFLQVKPHTPNFAGVPRTLNKNLSTSHEQAYSTQYYLHLMKGLLDGKTYGEAHVEADRNAKQSIYTDAEAIWDGKLFVDVEKPSSSNDESLV